MKRKYAAPQAKLIDFCYDEQIVATSTPPCKNYSMLSVDNPQTCWEELKDIPLRSRYAGCFYTDKE